MSCECFQQWLLVEYRIGSATASPCGTEVPSLGIRRVETLVQHFVNGDVTQVTTWAENIVTNLGSCDAPSVVSDWDPEFDYGDYIDQDLSYSGAYDPYAVLGASDAAVVWGEWQSFSSMSGTGAAALLDFRTLFASGSPLIFSSHFVVNEGVMNAESTVMEIRFTLKGPKLPVRIDYEFSEGQNGSVHLNSASDQQVVSIPYNATDVIETGNTPDKNELILLLVYFTPWNKFRSQAEGDDVSDEVTIDGHGMTTGAEFSFTELAGGTGLSTGVHYYAIVTSANTFKAAASLADAIAGTAVDFTDAITAGTIVVY